MPVTVFLFVLIAASLLLITILKFLRLPTMVGYLILGVAIGPYGLSLMKESTDLHELAELGIVALMFTLGLEFSTASIVKSKKFVFGLGGIQVSATMLITTLLTHYIIKVPWFEALLFGAIIAMSSTAVISKLLLDRAEVSTPHGNRSISVLVFQDLAVIPLLIYFSYHGSGSTTTLVSLGISSVVLVIFLTLIAPRIMPYIVDFFARQNSSEIFTLFALGLVIGLSTLTDIAGLSHALGAFVTGMLLSDSRHRYLIEDIIKPFRELFLGLFFISIGLLLNLEIFNSSWLDIIVISIMVLTIKPVIIYLAARYLHTHNWTAIYTAVALGGTGEFGFVLLTAAAVTDDNPFIHLMLAINLVCMIAPPIMVPLVEELRNRLVSEEWDLQARDVTAIAKTVKDTHDHVIILGYGQNGQIITKLLDKRKIPWVAIELDYEHAIAAGKAGLNVVFGDARHEETLIAAGIFKAKSLAVTYGIQEATVRAVHAAHTLVPKLPITVKVLGQSQIEEVRKAGASYLSITDIETGANMAARVMQEYGINSQIINQEIRELHDDMVKHGGGYIYETNTNDIDDAVPRQFRLVVHEDSPALGKSNTWLMEQIKELNINIERIEREDKKYKLADDEQLLNDDGIVIIANTFEINLLKVKIIDKPI